MGMFIKCPLRLGRLFLGGKEIIRGMMMIPEEERGDYIDQLLDMHQGTHQYPGGVTMEINYDIAWDDTLATVMHPRFSSIRIGEQIPMYNWTVTEEDVYAVLRRNPQWKHARELVGIA